MRSRRSPPLLALAGVAALAAGCDVTSWEEFVNMRRQPTIRYLKPSDFFADDSSARPLVDGVVPRAEPASSLPPPTVTAELLARGRESFNIYCSVCHGEDGYGRGMVVQRGFPAPPALHEQRLRKASAAQFVQVMEHGLGKMPSYAGLTSPQERWAIAAYIRALQLSQHAALEDVPTAERLRLAAGGASEEAPQ